MRAGEHDDVGAPAVPLDEARRDLGAHRLLVDEAAAHVGLGQRARFVAADQPHVALVAHSAGSGRAYSARFTVPGVASTETRPERVRSAAGLIAGTVPTNGIPG